MPNEVVTVCPYCNHASDKEELGYGGPRRGFYSRHATGESLPYTVKITEVEPTGFEECSHCKKQFAYRLVVRVECETAKVDFERPGLYIDTSEKSDG